MNTKKKLINQIKDAKENENFENIIKFCDELEKIDQNMIDVNYEKAFSYFNLGNFEKTIEYGEIYLKDAPDKERKSLAYGIIGAAYFEKENFDKSIEYCDKKLKLNPDDEEIKLMKAESLFEIGNFDESLEIAKELNDINLMAYCLFEKKEFEKSIRYFDELIDSTPDIIEILNYKEMKAKALFAMKKYGKFTQLGEEILKLSPNRNFYLFMSVAYDKLGDEENAVKYFKKASEVQPELMEKLIDFGESMQSEMYDENSAEDNLKWGHSYFQMQDYDKALEYYLKACELESENTEALKCVGEAYFKLKEYEKSFKYFKKALKTDEDNPDLLFGLAFISSLLAKPVML